MQSRATILALFITLLGAKCFAATEVRTLAADLYERTERQYVIAAGRSVEVHCAPGDTLVSGFCFAENRNLLKGEIGHRIQLESQELKQEGGGWKCTAQVLHAQQTLRLESTAFCKKSQPTS